MLRHVYCESITKPIFFDSGSASKKLNPGNDMIVISFEYGNRFSRVSVLVIYVGHVCNLDNHQVQLRSEKERVIEHVNRVFFLRPQGVHSILVYSYIGQVYCMIKEYSSRQRWNIKI